MSRPSSSCRVGPVRSAAASRSASSRASAARWRFSSVSGSTRRRARPMAFSAIDTVSSLVIAAVARSTSSWPSSMMTASCSGSTGMPSSASIASIAWLVTTMSASCASRRRLTVKHSSPKAHRLSPTHSRRPTEKARHTRGSTSSGYSSRSPVSVCSAQARTATACWPSALFGASNSALALVVRHRSVQLLQAHVVVAPLEDGERQRAADEGLDRLRHAGQVAVDELPLQGERGGRDDDGAAVGGRGVERGGHQVADGLARARAGLHDRVPGPRERRRDRLRHEQLPLAVLAPDGGDDRRERLREVGRLRRVSHRRRPRARWPAPPAPGRAGACRVSSWSTLSTSPCRWARLSRSPRE